ncbi:MAG: NTP transferase domain-containing protein [Haloarculaceae archaeon]
MDALVLCGGRGTRLDSDREKPLFEVCGAPMIDRVLAALADAAAVETVHAAVSPHAPDTRAHLRDGDRAVVVETPGEGYVADLGRALDRVGRPAVTAAADLPLLAPAHVSRAVERSRAAGGASVAVCVPAALKRRLDLSVDTTTTAGGRDLAPTGLNVVGATDADETMTTYDARLAVNVNRLSDAAVAEALCA